MLRNTIAMPLEVEGIGLHLGTPCRVTLLPTAQPGYGWRIQGVPLNEITKIKTRRATILTIHNREVSTVEHLFAALWSHRIHDIDIWVEGGEVPILDGSAHQWYSMVKPIRIDGPPIQRLCPERAISLTDGDSFLRLVPAREFRARVEVEYPGYPMEVFEGGLANSHLAMGARTFGYFHQLKGLNDRGLARGANLQNVLVLDPDGRTFEQTAKAPLELAKHKWLDLVGDLSLINRELYAHVHAFKASHHLHVQLVEVLRAL